MRLTSMTATVAALQLSSRRSGVRCLTASSIVGHDDTIPLLYSKLVGEETLGDCLDEADRDGRIALYARLV